jgi:hypothetical protein
MYLTRNYQSNKYTCISIVLVKYNWKYRAENRGRKNTGLSCQLTEEAGSIISPLSLGKKNTCYHNPKSTNNNIPFHADLLKRQVLVFESRPSYS